MQHAAQPLPKIAKRPARPATPAPEAKIPKTQSRQNLDALVNTALAESAFEQQLARTSLELNPFQERAVTIPIEQQVQNLYATLLQHPVFEFTSDDPFVHKVYLRDFLRRQQNIIASDTLIELLWQRFLQPLTDREILRRAKMLYEDVMQYYTFDSFANPEIVKCRFKDLIASTTIARQSLHPESLDRIVNKMIEMWKRDRMKKIDKIADEAAVILFSRIDCKKRSDESFAQYQNRLQGAVGGAYGSLVPTDVNLTTRDYAKIHEKIVDDLIQMQSNKVLEKVKNYENQLYAQLVLDPEFQEHRALFPAIDLTQFVKNNPRYVFLKNQILLDDVFDQVIQAVQKKFGEDNVTRLMEERRAKDKAKRMSTPGAARY